MRRVYVTNLTAFGLRSRALRPAFSPCRTPIRLALATATPPRGERGEGEAAR